MRHKKKIKNLVGLIDVMPTILGYMGIPCPAEVQGVDHSEQLKKHDGDFGEGSYYYCESISPTRYGCNELRGIVGDRYKYIQTPREELYHLSNDPHELENLADTEAEILRKMGLRLKRIWSEQSRDLRLDNVVEHSRDTIERLSSLGYVAGKVEEDGKFDPSKPDAKDYIDYHRLSRKYSIAMAEKQYDQARVICAEMSKCYPYIVNILSMTGYACFEQGNYREAIKYFREYLQSSEEDPDVHYLLGVSLVREGKAEEAVKEFKKTLSLAPNNVSAHANLAATLTIQQRHDESLLHYEKAFELGSKDPHLYVNHGLALVHIGNIDKAIAQWNKALELDPKLPEAHQNIGKAMSQQGRMAEAVRHWYMSLELKPDQPNLLNDIAWVISNRDNKDLFNSKKAVQMAQRACEITQYRNVQFLNTLAGAYAADEQLKQAIETARQAIALATSSNQLNLARQIKISMESYQRQLKNQ